VSLPLIGALGAGRMGRGIAHAFAYGGHEVVLVDIKPRAADAARALEREALAEVDQSLAMLASLGAFDDALRPRMLSRVRFAGREEAPAALAACDILFEGVPETLEAKREAFDYASGHVRPDAIVASTTSTMLSTELAGFVRCPERFLNAHWLNPAYLVPLVELSPHPGTAPEALARMKAVLEGIGKKPVVCAAAPGYIVPRFQSLVMNEAARMIEQGIATPGDIDAAVRYGFGFRYATMGVVEFIDFGGLDILYHASRYLARATGDERYAAPAIVDQRMAEGRLGLKTGGRGLADHSRVEPQAWRRQVLTRQLDLLRHLGLAPRPDAALTTKGRHDQR
jgi:3-hydroxybutyryl-CoA dehydrogenase